MTRYEADEFIEIVDLIAIFVSFIFSMTGLVKPESFFVVAIAVFISNIIGYYLLNYVDERDEP